MKNSEKHGNHSNYWPNAIVMQADIKDFSASETYSYPCVQSRFLVWCRTGKGILEINEQKFRMIPGITLMVPWNHHITYIPDRDNPFSLGTIHIVPDIKGTPEYFQVIHDFEPANPLWQQRHDEFLPGFENIVCRHLPEDSMLIKLAEYVALKHLKMASEDELRMQARMLMYELLNIGSAAEQTGMPFIMSRMIDCMNSCLELPEKTGNIAKRFNISIPSVYRYFKRYTGMTPNEYLMEKRLCRAAELLRSSGIHVADLSSNLQFSSPQYFIRCFKKRFGIPPGKYAGKYFTANADKSYLRPPFSIDNTGVKSKFPLKYIPESQREKKDDPDKNDFADKMPFEG